VNCVRKYYPWYPEYLLQNSRLDDLKRFGMNVVRLGSMWEGAEPVEGVYNETYIDILENIIQRLGDRGIFVILDMHQDVLSSLYAAYDGIPRWLADEFPEPTNPYPWPLEEITSWAMGYLTQACSEGFQHLYNNTYEGLDKWGAFWVKLANRLGHHPNLLGYEYMNEPWVGDFFSDPELMLPGIAGRRQLLPTYDALYEHLRKADPVSIQFYEPVTWGAFLEGGIVGSGFNRVPGGREYRNVSAFSYHTYCWNLEVLGPDASDEDRLQAIDNCTNFLIPKMFNTQREDVQRTGGASILTEYGLCINSGPELELPCEVYMRLADEFLQSWVEWDYSDNTWYNGDTGEPNWGKITANVRPYAQATAGVPLEMAFDPDTLVFRFRFKPNPSITEPTQLFVPSLRYNTGFVVSAIPPVLDWVTQGDLLFGHYIVSEEEVPEEISIVIRPN